MRLFLIEHSSAQEYEPTFTQIEKGFFCQDNANEYAKQKNSEYKNKCKEHDESWESHVEYCDIEEEDDEVTCPICRKWFNEQMERLENHNWEVIEIEVE